MTSDALRSILVHLDGGAGAEARLHLAMRLAARHGASVTALFAVTPQFLPLHWRGDAFSGRMPRAVDPEHRARAFALFERARAWTAAPLHWRELDDEGVANEVAQRAMISDLVVLGQRDPRDASGFDVPGDLTEAVIMGSGRPALVVPHGCSAVPLPQTILVAWRSTPECARALGAALPFLRGAGQVHLVCAEDAADESLGAPMELMPYLHLHGIDRVHEHRRLGDAHAGAGILSLAAETASDLVVMGCYGHGRARELVLGGASRTVLDGSRVALLMAH